MAKLHKNPKKQKNIPADNINNELYNQLTEIYKAEMQKNEWLFNDIKEPSEKLKTEKRLVKTQLWNQFDAHTTHTITANNGNIIHKFVDVVQVKSEFDKLIAPQKRFYYFKKE